MDAKLLEGFEERTAQVKGRDVRYFLGGPAGGPSVVLVHGLAGSSANWGLVAPALARSRRVLVVDLPGHGGSDPLPAAPSLEPYSDRVLRVAGLEGLERADYVGHSLGGLVALRAAVRAPERVRSLVLAASAGIGSSTRVAERALAFVGFVQPGRRVSPHWRAVARSKLLKRVVFSHWFAADPAALSPAAVEGTLRDVNLHGDTDSAWRALTRDDPRSDLHLVRCPVLLLWGADDNQLPIDDAFDYARRLRAPLRVIADCGHLLVLERPAACIDAIEGFLAARADR
jgi:pyruvate dehydrogenase E2 component (dihydrolipoamide acetyltransferase)